MTNISSIGEHMEVIGADGAHVGTVDRVEGDRIKLTKRDNGQGGREDHHRYLSVGLVADVEADKVRLSTTAANAFMFQEEDAGSGQLVTDASRERPAPPTRGPDTITVGKKAADLRPDWGTIGLGATALAALTGAALWARGNARRKSGVGFRLQTDENVRLISSSKVEGTPVVGRDGEHLGKIANFMVDKYTGQVAYAVMTFGGTLGFGEALFPLPWSYLTYDSVREGYVLGITKEQLASAPRFSASSAPEFSTSYRRDLGQFYGRRVR